MHSNGNEKSEFSFADLKYLISKLEEAGIELSQEAKHLDTPRKSNKSMASRGFMKPCTNGHFKATKQNGTSAWGRASHNLSSSDLCSVNRSQESELHTHRSCTNLDAIPHKITLFNNHNQHPHTSGYQQPVTADIESARHSNSKTGKNGCSEIRVNGTELRALKTTISVQARELEILRHQLTLKSEEAEKLEYKLKQLSGEHTSLAVRNSELRISLQSTEQIRFVNRCYEQALQKVRYLIGQARSENIMFQSELDKVLQKLSQVTNLKRQLALECAAVKRELHDAQVHSTLQQQRTTTGLSLTSFNEFPGVSQNSESDQRADVLRSKLRELEKRCALQQLRHEEVLLELEDINKRFRGSDTMLYSGRLGADPLSGLNSHFSTHPLLRTDSFSRRSEVGGLNEGNMVGSEHAFMPDGILQNQPVGSLQRRGRVSSGMSASTTRSALDPNLVELFQTADDLSEPHDIPAPKSLTLERQLVHSVLIGWKHPENATKSISAYHVYVDGQFRMSVKTKEKTKALLDNVDADKPHRISVRAICTKGQSKDAECTLVVGRGMTATPGRLRATQITTTTAKLGWMPGNSNFWHRVFLNETELHVCPPGVYKVMLTDLLPDTLHSVCVQAMAQNTSQADANPRPPRTVSQTGVDIPNLAAFIEFRTLPIGMPDPPTNVQLELGPQDGMILVTWLPVPQDQDAAVTASSVGTSLPVQGYTVCLNEQSLMEVQGASNDHALLPLTTIKQCLDTICESQTLDMKGVSPSHHRTHSDLAVENSQALFITVHSTVPLCALKRDKDTQVADTNESTQLLKGSGGPASLPVSLEAELLIKAAGSLRSAVEVFGPNLSARIGINETASRRAGIPLAGDKTSTQRTSPTLQLQDHFASAEAGLVTISADASVRKSSPMTNAVGMAEALLRQRGVLMDEERRQVTSSPETRRNNPTIRGYHYHRPFKPWPWPVHHSTKARTLLSHQSPIHPHKSTSRRAWRQVRSMSDEYDPHLRFLRGTDMMGFHGDSNESLLSSDIAPDRLYSGGTHSLSNLQVSSKREFDRNRGPYKSSLELNTMEPSSGPRGYAIDTHRVGLIRRPDHRALHNRSAVEAHRQSRCTPGPIVTAFSSSSTEDKRGANRSGLEYDDRDHERISGRIDSLQQDFQKHRKSIPYRRFVDDVHSGPQNLTMGTNRIPKKEQFDLPAIRRDRVNSPTPRLPVASEQMTYPSTSASARGIPTSRSERSSRTTQPAGPTDVRFVIALHTYDPATMSPNPDAIQEELPFQEGQVIRIFGQLDEDGFYTGECNGLRGLVPSNMVSQPESYRYDSPSHTTQPISDWRHDRGDQMSARPPGQVFKADDEVASNSRTYPTNVLAQQHRSGRGPGIKLPDARSPVRHPQDPGRQYAPSPIPNSSNSRHLLPVNGHEVMYQRPSIEHLTTWNAPVRLPDQPVMQGRSDDKNERHMRSRGHTTQREMVAIYDYDPTVLSPNADAELELSFKTGDKVIVFGEMDEDGFYSGELADGRRGLVPSNFLRECSSSVQWHGGPAYDANQQFQETGQHRHQPPPSADMKRTTRPHHPTT